MNREQYLNTHLPAELKAAAIGQIVDELTIDEFEAVHKRIFDYIMKIHEVDVSDTSGYGEFSADGILPYQTFKDFIIHTFDDTREGYWKNWKTLFDGPLLDKDFFDTYYHKMLQYSDHCEGKRCLNNGYVYYGYMTITPETVGLMAWDRAGVYDWMIDFATLELNKPYLHIPEKLHAYLKEKGLCEPYFKERFLCMTFYRGIDSLRWHASIDDEASCKSIMASLATLEERILNLE